MCWFSWACTQLQEAELTKLLNCSHHFSAGTEAVLNSSFKSAPRKSAEASIYLVICSPQWVLQVGVPIVVTLNKLVVPVITGGGVTMHY